MRCRRLLHRRFLVYGLCDWLCLCLQRCLCPSLTLSGCSIWVLGLRLAGLSCLLLWFRCTGIFCFWFGTWLLTRKAARSKSRTGETRPRSRSNKERRPSVEKQVRFANKTEDIDGLPLNRLSLEDRKRSDAALQALRRNSTHALSAKELQALRSARPPSAPIGGWKDPWRDIKNAIGGGKKITGVT